MKLERGKAYVNRAGGFPSHKEILYFAEIVDGAGFRCDRCGKEFNLGTKTYAFDFGPELDGRKGGIVLGSECVRRLTPADQSEERTMSMSDLRSIYEAKFSSAGKGMEWGDKEPVTPETLPSFVEKLKRDEGMFIVGTYTRMGWYDRKAWDAWEKVGKPMIKVAKDGRGFFTIEGQKYVYTQPSSVFWVPKQRVEESAMETKGKANVDDMRTWIDRCAGIELAALGEATRPLGGLDVAMADDEVAIHFESGADAQLVYDFLTGVGTGVRLLEPGEVTLRVIEGWDQKTVNFAPHVRYLKPEIIAAVVEAFSDQIQEAAVGALHGALREDVQALVEFNPYHASSDGTFASKGELSASKRGSFSKGARKNKVSGKTRKGLKLVATKLPCGRDARDRGKNQRCWDGAKLDWTGQAAARVLKKAKAKGKIHDAITADDRAILERAARALNARATAVDEACGGKKAKAKAKVKGKAKPEVEEGFGSRSGRGQDPRWIRAREAGKDRDGTSYRKGEDVFYYPNTQTILAGKAADKASAEFDAARDDERFTGGM